MAINLVSSRHAIPADRTPPIDDTIPDWSERLITAVATALAVVLVAVVAVLMGSV
jgi:hypothetical protein